MSKKRNITVDILKGWAIVTVVFIHVFRGKGQVEIFMGEIGRWAVPAFFMVQGFYMHLAARKQWLALAARRIKRVYLPFIIFSLAYGVYFYLFDGKLFTMRDVLLGKTAVHLYYIIHYMVFALSLPLLYKLPKKVRDGCLCGMFISNFAICLILELQRAYGIRFISYSGFNPTKWWGFVALGMWLAERPQLLEKGKKNKGLMIILSSFIAMFGLLYPYWTNRLGYMYNRSSLFPLAIGMTALIIFVYSKNNMPAYKIWAYIGRQSFGIYLLHFFIVHVLKYILRIQIFWLIAVLTIAICLFILEGSKRLKSFYF